MKKTVATPDQVADFGKIPGGTIAVFKNGKMVELSGPPLGKNEEPKNAGRTISKNFESFKNPVTGKDETIGVTGPYITNQLGGDIKGLDHFLVPQEMFATV